MKTPDYSDKHTQEKPAAGILLWSRYYYGDDKAFLSHIQVVLKALTG